MIFFLTILAILTLFILLVIGLISPQAGLFWYKGRRTRLLSFGMYASAIVLIMCVAKLTEHKCTRNAILDKYPPESREYKTELLTHLRTANLADLDYYIEDYSEKDDRQFLDVSMHSKELCAITQMEITGVEKMAGIISEKAMGSHGAGLDELKFRIDSVDGNYHFYITDFDHIID